MSNPEKDCSNYSNFVKIGIGACGIVYRAKDNRNGYYVAIKEIMKEKFDNAKEIMEKEVNILKKLANENSVKFIELIESNSYYYIVMEFCEYNLQTFMNIKKNAPLSINEIKTVLSQLNNTFKLMLKAQLIHRDIKPSNILISMENLDKCSIKLSDYGLTKELSSSITFSGTPLIMAPEVLNDEEDITKSDLWSIGILIYFMYFKEYPYNGKSEVALLKDIKSGKKIKTIPNDDLNDLISKSKHPELNMLIMNPKKVFTLKGHKGPIPKIIQYDSKKILSPSNFALTTSSASTAFQKLT